VSNTTLSASGSDLSVSITDHCAEYAVTGRSSRRCWGVSTTALSVSNTAISVSGTDLSVYNTALSVSITDLSVKWRAEVGAGVRPSLHSVCLTRIPVCLSTHSVCPTPHLVSLTRISLCPSPDSVCQSLFLVPPTLISACLSLNLVSSVSTAFRRLLKFVR